MAKFKQFIRPAKAFHVSPDANLVKLRPAGSKKIGYSGVFVTPTFNDAIAWGVSYITHKKSRTQERKGGFHGTPHKYQDLTIYELEMPKYILDNSWDDNSWEREYFIAEEFIPQIKIIRSKTYDIHDLVALYNKIRNIRYEQSSPGAYKTAVSLKGNYASSAYIQLFNTIQQKRLSGWTPSEDSLYDINNKMKELERLFMDQNWDHMGKPQQEFDISNKTKVDAIVKEIQQMIR